MARINGTNDPPRISVIVPSYNQGRFLEETLRSILLQGYPHVEVRVYDGGSTDGSAQILERYEPFLDYWQSQVDRGQSHAINLGFQQARGEILAWLNSDDRYEPGALSVVAAAAKRDPAVQVICGDCVMMDEQAVRMGLKVARNIGIEHFLSGGSVPGQPAVFLRRGLLEQVGPLREDLHYLLDWELWLRVALCIPPDAVRLIHQPLACARIWDGAKTANAGEQSIRERQKVIEELLGSDFEEGFGELLRTARADVHWRWAMYYGRERRRRDQLGHFVAFLKGERRLRVIVKRVMRLLQAS